MIPKLSIQIITFNNRQFIKDCLDSLFKQTYQDFSILIIDNASNDGTVKFIHDYYSIKQIKKDFKSSAKLFVFRNIKNVGFAQAHNQGLKMSQSELVLVINPDIILEPNFLERLIKVLTKDEKIGSVGGKLLKIRLGDLELQEKIRTKLIDSTGLTILKSRRVIDRGEGEEDQKQYDKKTKVFGISGACVLYRKQALEDVRVLIGQAKEKIEYFDQDFFAYKEDVDLAWRLNLRGWQAVYVPQAKAYHFRAGASIDRRFSQAKLINFLSFRNHSWMLLKNNYARNFLIHLFYILGYQISKKSYLLLTQPLVLVKSGFSFYTGLHKMYQKRKYILSRAKVGPKEMRKWFQ